jgi:TnsA endonuclease N terminal
MSYKGKFSPRNPQKYLGDYKNIIYRSSWECRVMDWFDKNPDVLSWSSEEMCVPYVSPVDGKRHRYFPDFVIKVKQKTSGQVTTFMIEVKPEKQSKPPQKKSRVTKQFVQEVVTWGVNQAKWKAAIEYCNDRNWQFRVMVSTDGTQFKYLTENELMLN